MFVARKLMKAAVVCGVLSLGFLAKPAFAGSRGLINMAETVGGSYGATNGAAHTANDPYQAAVDSGMASMMGTNSEAWGAFYSAYGAGYAEAAGSGGGGTGTGSGSSGGGGGGGGGGDCGTTCDDDELEE